MYCLKIFSANFGLRSAYVAAYLKDCGTEWQWISGEGHIRPTFNLRGWTTGGAFTRRNITPDEIFLYLSSVSRGENVRAKLEWMLIHYSRMTTLKEWMDGIWKDYENTVCHMYICQNVICHNMSIIFNYMAHPSKCGGKMWVTLFVTLKSDVLHLVLLENTKYKA